MLCEVVGGEWVCPCLFDELIDGSLAAAWAPETVDAKAGPSAHSQQHSGTIQSRSDQTKQTHVKLTIKTQNETHLEENTQYLAYSQSTRPL